MSDGRWHATGERLVLKIVVSGGPATGKTSFVGATRRIGPSRGRERPEGHAPGGVAPGSGPGGEGRGPGGEGLGSGGEERGPVSRYSYGPVVAYEPGGGAGAQGSGEGTVPLDFGRIVLRPDLTLCLFGVPGLERSVALCEDMCAGALGAVVLVDTGRLAESFALVDRLEDRSLPFVVVVNRFAGPAAYTPEQVASALGLSPGVPVLAGDVREATTVRHVLAELVAYTGRYRAARLLEAVSR
ncbi:GTP-binding protein [Streptomyces sp. NRRL F-5630]|uniref:GTP-binding protein n=1 Tax=Streptomyces sp. NRRL F-5630 TaxID=1463864 RepID=UPI003D708EE0